MPLEKVKLSITVMILNPRKLQLSTFASKNPTSIMPDLMNEFFENDYEFILTSKFKSDSTERRFSQYRQMRSDRCLEVIPERS